MDKKIRQAVRKILSEGDWWDNNPSNPANVKDVKCQHEIVGYDFVDGNVKVSLNWNSECQHSQIPTPDHVIIEQDPDLIDYIIKGFGADTEITEIFSDDAGNLTLKSGLASMIVPVNVVDSIVDSKLD